MTLYRLFNIHQTEQDRKEDCRGDVKIIGYFRTPSDCRAAMEKLADKPGFNLPDARFEIEKIRVRGGNPGRDAVYSLTHESYDGVYDHVTRIGVYATRKKAVRTWLRVRKSRRFRRHPTGFSLLEERIGVVGWEEGFTGFDESAG